MNYLIYKVRKRVLPERRVFKVQSHIKKNKGNNLKGKSRAFLPLLKNISFSRSLRVWRATTHSVQVP